MTDYTPDDDITFHCGGLSFKFSEYARIKQEHAELVEVLEKMVSWARHFSVLAQHISPDGPYTNDIEKANAILEKVK